jgi:DNA-directed RNA polymerase
MTINYSLTYRSAIDYFFQESNKELKDILLNFNEEETTKFIKKLKDEIKNFYQFLKFDVEREELFEKSSNELISTWHEGKELKTCDNATINLNYKKLIKKSIEVKIGNTRLSMVEHVATSEFDKRKTNIALRANIVHSMDSFFVRAILNDKSMITIHDSFGIDIASTPLLIDKANKIFTNDVFKEKILIHNKSLKKTYSIFLLL